MKGGPFGLSLPWRDLALGGFRIVSKKWTAGDQCEDCSLKKKKQSGIFPLKENHRLKMNTFDVGFEQIEDQNV